MLDRIFDLAKINENTDYQKNPFDIGDIKLFSETVQQLSIMTFKNMQKYYKNLD